MINQKKPAYAEITKIFVNPMRPVPSSSQAMVPRYKNFQYVSEDSEDDNDNE